MTPEMIDAIAGLWKLVTATAALFAIFLFRKPLVDRLGKLSRVKTKEAEVEFGDDKKEDGKRLESVSPPPKPIEEETDKKLISDTNSHPNSKENLFGNMIDAFHKKEADNAKKAFDALQASETDLKNRLRNEVIYNYFSYTKTKNSNSIDELVRLSKIDEIRSLALYWLSECYQFDNAFEKAKSTLKLSLESATTDEGKADRAKAMVDLLLKTESPVDEAFEILSDTINNISKENHTPIYLAYAEIYKRTQNKLLRAIAIEKAAEINPSDSSMVFSAAHALSEAELPALAITNYEAVLRQNPDDAAALNNLGAEFDGLDMPIESVNFYNKSSEKKETLAMSNLAYKYISQGFIAEAEELLKAEKFRN